MIRYEQFCRIRQGYDQEHLSVAQLAGELGLNAKTVAHWVAQKDIDRVRGLRVRANWTRSRARFYACSPSTRTAPAKCCKD